MRIMQKRPGGTSFSPGPFLHNASYIMRSLGLRSGGRVAGAGGRPDTCKKDPALRDVKKTLFKASGQTAARIEQIFLTLDLFRYGISRNGEKRYYEDAIRI